MIFLLALMWSFSVNTVKQHQQLLYLSFNICYIYMIAEFMEKITVEWYT